MPKLSDPRITKGHAADFVIRLYLDEPEFVAELQELRAGYLELLAQLIVKQVEFLVRCRAAMSGEEYQKMARDLYASASIGASIPTLPVSLMDQLEDIRQRCSELRPYFRDLEQLAFRWKLRARWAGPMLHLYHVHDCLKNLVIPDSIDLPLEQLDLLYPWPPPVPALEIKVSAWAFVFYGRKHIQAEIARKLKDYEDGLKVAGLKEKPSALGKHARWWFEHYVKGKPYQELAQESPGAYEETIKRKVWEFSRLAGIRNR